METIYNEQKKKNATDNEGKKKEKVKKKKEILREGETENNGVTLCFPSFHFSTACA